MLGSSDHSGAFALLIGLVLVVFCGIGISLIADRRFEFGASETSIKGSIAKDLGRIESLKMEISNAEGRWQRDHAHAVDHDGMVSALAQRISESESKLAELRLQRQQLSRALDRVEKDFLAYRISYRRQARAASVGDTVDLLTLTNGREYRRVVIRGFDAEGLRIAHARGTARIPFCELPNSWKERFQWHPSETLDTKPKPLTKPSPVEAPATNEATIPEPRLEKRPARETSSGLDTAELAQLRNHFLLTRGAYRDIQNQASIARRNATTSQKSVPGSLETWAERAVRLEHLGQSRYSDFIQARTRLSAVSPDDPLLESEAP